MNSPSEFDDDTHSVFVTVTPSGRLDHLRLSSEWRTRIDPSHLGHVVVLLLAQVRLTQGMSRIAAMHDRTPVDPLAQYPASALREMAHRAWNIVDSIRSAAEAGDLAVRETITDDHHHVTITLSNSDIVSIDLDRAWLRKATTNSIVTTINDVIEQAMDREPVSPAQSAASELKAMLDDLMGVR